MLYLFSPSPAAGWEFWAFAFIWSSLGFRILLALPHEGVHKWRAFFPNPTFLWCLFASGVSAKCSLPINPAHFCHLDLGNLCDLWAALVSALNLFFHLELVVCKIVLCCLFQMFPYFLSFQMGKLWIRSQMSSVWCCCLSWGSPVDGGTGFCAAPERTENLAHLINSLFGWDLFGLVASCVKVGQNSTPKYHCPYVRSVSKCPKMFCNCQNRGKTRQN